eukprot:1681314-Pleurochrysis_carterae.AAC.7
MPRPQYTCCIVWFLSRVSVCPLMQRGWLIAERLVWRDLLDVDRQMHVVRHARNVSAGTAVAPDASWRQGDEANVSFVLVINAEPVPLRLCSEVPGANAFRAERCYGLLPPLGQAFLQELPLGSELVAYEPVWGHRLNEAGGTTATSAGSEEPSRDGRPSRAEATLFGNISRHVRLANAPYASAYLRAARTHSERWDGRKGGNRMKRPGPPRFVRMLNRLPHSSLICRETRASPLDPAADAANKGSADVNVEGENEAGAAEDSKAACTVEAAELQRSAWRCVAEVPSGRAVRLPLSLFETGGNLGDALGSGDGGGGRGGGGGDGDVGDGGGGAGDAHADVVSVSAAWRVLRLVDDRRLSTEASQGGARVQFDPTTSPFARGGGAGARGGGGGARSTRARSWTRWWVGADGDTRGDEGDEAASDGDAGLKSAVFGAGLEGHLFEKSGAVPTGWWALRSEHEGDLHVCEAPDAMASVRVRGGGAAAVVSESAFATAKLDTGGALNLQCYSGLTRHKDCLVQARKRSRLF